MLRETEADRTANSQQSDGIKHQQELSVDNEPDIWKRASSESPFAKMIDNVMNLFGQAVYNYGKDLEKQSKNIKRF